MKKTVPFSKEILFKTKIAEITDIEVEHNLKKDEDNTIQGTFNVVGSYKMTEASQIEENFNYELPFIIEVDKKYDIENIEIKISDFYFEIINEDTLKVNIEILLDNINEIINKPILERCYDVEELEENEEIKNEKEDVENDVNMDFEEKINDKFNEYSNNINIKEEIEPIDINDQEKPIKLDIEKPITEIFSTVKSSEDTFKTYHVYIVRENDTLDSIITKYKTTKESLQEYNDLSDIKIGTKLIIPSTNE